MKKLIPILIVLLLTGSLFSQSIGIFGGYGMSAFDKKFLGDGTEQAGFIPVGANLMFGNGSLEFGAEVSYAAIPVTFEISNNDVHLLDLKMNQLYFGGLVKFTINTRSKIAPYIRGGAGMFMGKAEIEYTKDAKDIATANGQTLEDKDIDSKNAFGFNAGGGLKYKLNRKTNLFIEFVYNIVTRQYDTEGSEEFGANNWIVQAGVSFGL